MDNQAKYNGEARTPEACAGACLAQARPARKDRSPHLAAWLRVGAGCIFSEGRGSDSHPDHPPLSVSASPSSIGHRSSYAGKSAVEVPLLMDQQGGHDLLWRLWNSMVGCQREYGRTTLPGSRRRDPLAQSSKPVEATECPRAQCYSGWPAPKTKGQGQGGTGTGTGTSSFATAPQGPATGAATIYEWPESINDWGQLPGRAAIGLLAHGASIPEGKFAPGSGNGHRGHCPYFRRARSQKLAPRCQAASACQARTREAWGTTFSFECSLGFLPAGGHRDSHKTNGSARQAHGFPRRSGSPVEKPLADCLHRACQAVGLSCDRRAGRRCRHGDLQGNRCTGNFTQGRAADTTATAAQLPARSFADRSVFGDCCREGGVKNPPSSQTAARRRPHHRLVARNEGGRGHGQGQACNAIARALHGLVCAAFQVSLYPCLEDGCRPFVELPEWTSSSLDDDFYEVLLPEAIKLGWQLELEVQVQEYGRPAFWADPRTDHDADEEDERLLQRSLQDAHWERRWHMGHTPPDDANGFSCQESCLSPSFHEGRHSSELLYSSLGNYCVQTGVQTGPFARPGYEALPSSPVCGRANTCTAKAPAHRPALLCDGQASFSLLPSAIRRPRSRVPFADSHPHSYCRRVRFSFEIQFWFPIESQLQLPGSSANEPVVPAAQAEHVGLRSPVNCNPEVVAGYTSYHETSLPRTEPVAMPVGLSGFCFPLHGNILRTHPPCSTTVCCGEPCGFPSGLSEVYSTSPSVEDFIIFCDDTQPDGRDPATPVVADGHARAPKPLGDITNLEVFPHKSKQAEHVGFRSPANVTSISPDSASFAAFQSSPCSKTLAPCTTADEGAPGTFAAPPMSGVEQRSTCGLVSDSLLGSDPSSTSATCGFPSDDGSQRCNATLIETHMSPDCHPTLLAL